MLFTVYGSQKQVITLIELKQMKKIQNLSAKSWFHVKTRLIHITTPAACQKHSSKSSVSRTKSRTGRMRQVT